MPIISEDVQTGGVFGALGVTSVAATVSSSTTANGGYVFPVSGMYASQDESLKGAPQDVLASLTIAGRTLLARQPQEGLGIKIVGFRMGRYGYSTSAPTEVLPIDDTDTELRDPIFPLLSAPVEPIDRYEAPNDTGMSYLCRIASGEAIAPLGEWGLYAEITYSPNDPTEVGDQYLFAIVHRPLLAKTLQDVSVNRLVLQFGSS